jgi:hypothetical protein
MLIVIVAMRNYQAVVVYHSCMPVSDARAVHVALDRGRLWMDEVPSITGW